MIGRITGTLAEKSPPLVLVDVGGVGYEVDVPMSTFFNLPGLGERVTLLTHFVVREDAQVLFGFLTAPERATFAEMLATSPRHRLVAAYASAEDAMAGIPMAAAVPVPTSCGYERESRHGTFDKEGNPTSSTNSGSCLGSRARPGGKF